MKITKDNLIKLILSLLLFCSLILNVIILKSIQTLKTDLNDVAYNVDNIDTNVWKVSETIKEIEKDIDNIESDLYSIKYDLGY